MSLTNMHAELIAARNESAKWRGLAERAIDCVALWRTSACYHRIIDNRGIAHECGECKYCKINALIRDYEAAKEEQCDL